MNQKKRTVFAATMTLLAAAMFAAAFIPTDTSLVDAVPDGSGTEADPYLITIQVGQAYEYTPVFNIKNVNVTAVIASGTGISAPAVSTGKVSFTGSATGVTKVKITGASVYMPDNKADQYLEVTVVATLAIVTETLTFYKDVAGSEGQVTSTNDPNVVYSAKGLPAGLHMDASGNGLIYGKATAAIGTSATVAITATNTETGISVSKDITVKVVANPSVFTLAAGDGVVADGAKYYVLNDAATFKFTSGTTAGTWVVKASGDFNEKMSYAVADGIITFTKVSGELSGDYVVYFAYTNGGSTTETYVVIHFQAPLGYDTAPKASYYVSYSGAGSGLVAVS